MGGIHWLASYPKSGNTWMRCFIANLRAGADAPVGLDELDAFAEFMATSRDLLDDVLGFATADLHEVEAQAVRADVHAWMRRERGELFVKIHDACLDIDGRPLIPAEGMLGALYLLRNPLDVAPSLAHYFRIDIDAAIAMMAETRPPAARPVADNVGFVHTDMRNWSEHVLSWVDATWLRREVVRYEDLLDDPLATFARAAAFLGLPADAESVARAVHFSRFEELARQERESGFLEAPTGVRFFRAGRTGAWRGELDAAQVARIVADHGAVMRRFGYLDTAGNPI